MLCVILLSKYIIKFSTVIGLPFDETTASVGLLTVIYCHDTIVSRANFHVGKTRLTLLNLSEYVGLNVKMYGLSLYRYYDEMFILSFLRILTYTAWKVSKYGVFSGPYFPLFKWCEYDWLFSSKTGNNGPEKTPYLDNLFAVLRSITIYPLIVTLIC